ncbi:MAG TPA: hypothetical protein VFW23_02330 [Tepidisphaeraceae bacterium]|nr:hypothetical protein [Tepidisphaeraceae bacterium]
MNIGNMIEGKTLRNSDAVDGASATGIGTLAGFWAGSTGEIFSDESFIGAIDTGSTKAPHKALKQVPFRQAAPRCCPGDENARQNNRIDHYDETWARHCRSSIAPLHGQVRSL